jgi:homoserine O-acetyltransferase
MPTVPIKPWDSPHSVGLVVPQSFAFAKPPDELELDCGKRFGPIRVAYETYGTLDETRSNAVLILHALSGDAHVAGYHSPGDPKPGWWDMMVGPGEAFDTDQYFVVCSNVLGGCKGTEGPGSVDPRTSRPYGAGFPIVTIRDMVRVQCALADHLGIDRWLSMAGGSMGGMQVLEWAITYPDRVVSAIPIATASRLSDQGLAFDYVGRAAIRADEGWAEGHYHGDDGPRRGLAIARMLGHITYLSERGMRERFGRRLQDEGRDRAAWGMDIDFAVESYLEHQGRSFVERFDSNSYLYITRAMDTFDLVEREGSLEAAFANVKAGFLVIAFTSDWLFPPRQSRELVRAMRAHGLAVSYCEIESSYGHDAFLLEKEHLSRLISGYLSNQYREVLTAHDRAG